MAVGGVSSKPTGQREMDGHSRRLGDHYQEGVSGGQSRDHSCSDTSVHTHLTGQTMYFGVLGLSTAPSPEKNSHSRGSHQQSAVTPRPYGFTYQEALELMKRCRGTAWSRFSLPGGGEAS